ncbi:OsmC family protein [Hugenholtzia roseola]|uniref:OsmC family protein n=1 Tax=Hugenholtzia roseola TaxID=1002 RepID=UPI00040C1B19|nr:OsmC family protein [Hugenholtzia roseola]
MTTPKEHQIEVRYLQSLRTQATHLASKNQILTDAPLDNQGKGEAFSPTDLVASALASCGMTIMGIVAQRESLDLGQMQMQVTKIMADNPRRIAAIKVHYFTPEPLDISEKMRKMLQNAALNCPVAKSLHPDIEQLISFDF